MALETTKEKLIWQGLVPIVGAVIGAIVATWFQAATIDKAQLADVVALLKDPSLTGPQKISALEIYKEITDRPWSVLRSLVSVGTVLGAAIGFAYAFRLQNRPYK
jgi:hypothetical protein